MSQFKVKQDWLYLSNRNCIQQTPIWYTSKTFGAPGIGNDQQLHGGVCVCVFVLLILVKVQCAKRSPIKPPFQPQREAHKYTDTLTHIWFVYYFCVDALFSSSFFSAFSVPFTWSTTVEGISGLIGLKPTTHRQNIALRVFVRLLAHWKQASARLCCVIKLVLFITLYFPICNVNILEKRHLFIYIFLYWNVKTDQ